MGEYSGLETVVAKAGPELAIHVDNPPITVPGQPKFFHPGDTITGFVSRQQHIVAPRGTITISLIGRSSIIYTKRRGGGEHRTTRYYHSKFILFEATTQVYDGPLHIPVRATEPQIWPFSLTMPTNPSTMTSNIQRKRPERSFLPLDPQSISDTPLPPTFHFHSGHSSDELDAWVEYYLEATLTEEHAGTSFFTGGPKSPKIKHARQPIPVSTPSAPPLLDYHIHRHKMPSQFVYSQRLLPGRGPESKLGTREHMAKFFRTSSVPRYAFSVELEFPSILQFGNQIPLGIRVVPDARLTAESIVGVQQPVRLFKVELRITAKVATKVDYEDSWNTEGYTKDGKVYLEVNFENPWERQAVGGDIVVPSAWPAGLDKKIGEAAGKEVAVVGESVTRGEEGGPAGGESSNPPSYTGPGIPAQRTKAEEAGLAAATTTDATSGAASGASGSGSGPSTNPNPTIHLPGPSNAATAQGDSAAPFLNLGERMQLQLASDRLPRLGGKRERWGAMELAPDFVSYNIALAHLLKWEVTLDVVGEKVKLAAEHPVRLVGGWN